MAIIPFSAGACPKGTFTNSTSNDCVPCPGGSFSNQGSQTSCTPCSAGKFVATEGATSSSQCDACPRGTFGNRTGLSICDKCGPGFYASTEGDTICSACDAGKASTNTSSTSRTNCFDCERGWFSSAGQSACSKCEIGRFAQDARQSACEPCSAGTFSTIVGASHCQLCFKGYHSASPGATRCDACLPGSFQATNGSSTCDSCLAGRYAPSAALTICLDCGVGAFSSTGQSQCTECSAGRFNSITAATACQSCAKGTFGTLVGHSSASEACAPCQVGSYSTQTGSSVCELCSEGKASNTSGSSHANDCRSCARGTVASAGASVCHECEPGRYQRASQQSACDGCPPGRASKQVAADNVDFCLICEAGHFAAGNASSCLPCQPGSWSSSSEASACNPCQVGRFSAKSGEVNNTCAACPLGYIASAEGSALCTPCAQGWIATQLGSSACTQCLNGLSTAGTGQHECTTCAPGRFSNGQTCTECARGRFAATTGQTECYACPPGTSARAGASSCISCGPITDLSESPSPCADAAIGCPAGFFINATNRLCSACPAGKTAHGTSSECSDECQNCVGGGQCAEGSKGYLCGECETGYFRDVDECLPCDNDTWAVVLVVVLAVAFVVVAYFCNKRSKKKKGAWFRILARSVQFGTFMMGMAVAWPLVIRRFYRVMSLGLDFSVFHPECINAWSYYETLAVAVFVPLGFELVFVAGVLVFERQARKLEKEASEPPKASLLEPCFAFFRPCFDRVSEFFSPLVAKCKCKCQPESDTSEPAKPAPLANAGSVPELVQGVSFVGNEDFKDDRKADAGDVQLNVEAGPADAPSAEEVEAAKKQMEALLALTTANDRAEFCRTTIVLLVTLAYASQVALFLAIFRCTDAIFPETGYAHLLADQSIACGGSKYWTVFSFCILGIIVEGVGLNVFIVWRLYRHSKQPKGGPAGAQGAAGADHARNRSISSAASPGHTRDVSISISDLGPMPIQSTEDAEFFGDANNAEGKANESGKQAQESWFESAEGVTLHPLYESYTPTYLYWEAVIMSKDFLTLIIIELFRFMAVVQTLLNLILACAYLYVARWRPFDKDPVKIKRLIFKDFANTMSITASAANCISLVIALCMAIFDVKGDGAEVLGAFAFLINGLTLLCIVVPKLYGFEKEMRKRELVKASAESKLVRTERQLDAYERRMTEHGKAGRYEQAEAYVEKVVVLHGELGKLHLGATKVPKAADPKQIERIGNLVTKTVYLKPHKLKKNKEDCENRRLELVEFVREGLAEKEKTFTAMDKTHVTRTAFLAGLAACEGLFSEFTRACKQQEIFGAGVAAFPEAGRLQAQPRKSLVPTGHTGSKNFAKKLEVQLRDGIVKQSLTLIRASRTDTSEVAFKMAFGAVDNLAATMVEWRGKLKVVIAEILLDDGKAKTGAVPVAAHQPADAKGGANANAQRASAMVAAKSPASACLSCLTLFEDDLELAPAEKKQPASDKQQQQQQQSSLELTDVKSQPVAQPAATPAPAAPNAPAVPEVKLPTPSEKVNEIKQAYCDALQLVDPPANIRKIIFEQPSKWNGGETTPIKLGHSEKNIKGAWTTQNGRNDMLAKVKAAYVTTVMGILTHEDKAITYYNFESLREWMKYRQELATAFKLCEAAANATTKDAGDTKEGDNAANDAEGANAKNKDAGDKKTAVDKDGEGAADDDDRDVTFVDAPDVES